MVAASVVAADMNADGTLDLVIGNGGQAGSTVTVLLGNGDGTFQPAAGYGAGGTIGSIAIADLNGDANPDVAVANRSGDVVDVLMGMGDGTLHWPIPYHSGGAMATGIAVADMDRDDKPDLIVSNWTSATDRGHGAVGVLIGNGDGTFRPPVSYGSGGYGGSSLAIADVNGDDYQDVVVAQLRSQRYADLHRCWQWRGRGWRSVWKRRRNASQRDQLRHRWARGGIGGYR